MLPVIVGVVLTSVVIFWLLVAFQVMAREISPDVDEVLDVAIIKELSSQAAVPNADVPPIQFGGVGGVGGMGGGAGGVSGGGGGGGGGGSW